MPKKKPQKASSQEDYYAPKPSTNKGFLGPVSWLGGREFVASLKGIIIYSIYGQGKDIRSWMKSNIYPSIEGGDEKNTAEEQAKVSEFWTGRAGESWDWKSRNFEWWNTYLRDNPVPKGSEFWFDYISDTGDGQMAVYNVACLCLSDLWLTKNTTDVRFFTENPLESELLPRGSFLFIGGDTGYYVADHSTLQERFQLPFRWAFASVRKHLVKYYSPIEEVRNSITEDGMIPGKIGETEEEYWDTEPVRPLFGVPANHDYYDDIDGFNRQFRRAPFEKPQENKKDLSRGAFPLSIPTFQREQEATYIALRLPFDWWLLGIDSELAKLDFRQRIYFGELMENLNPKKVVLATPEPTTVFNRKCKEDDKTAVYLRDITEPLGLEQPFLKNGTLIPLTLPGNNQAEPVEPGDYCRLDLSGDVHHYARYWGPKNSNGEFSSDNYASLVSGGGGAFLHPTETTKGRKEDRIEPQLTFPAHEDSRSRVAKRIFDLENIRQGGYVQTAGAVIAVVIFACLTYYSDTKYFFELVKNPVWTLDAVLRLLSYISVAIPVILIFFTGKLMHDYVAKLQEVRSKASAEPEKDLGARISELRPPVFLFLAGIVTYVVWLAVYEYGYQALIDPSDSKTPGYVTSLLLIAHFVITFLIVGLSIEWGNFATIKYKYFPDTQDNPDDWSHILVETSKFGFLESGNNPLSRRWLSYRKFTIRSLPIIILNGVALAVLFSGMRNFGITDVRIFAVNLIFTIVVFGGFVGVFNFALGTAECETKKDIGRKLGFGIIGVLHALLQLSTVFVLVFYADWRVVILLLFLTILTNGNSIRNLTKGTRINFGAWAMQKCGREGFRLFATWFVFGLIVIGAAFFSKSGLPCVVDDSLRARTIPCLVRTAASGWIYWITVLAIVAYLGHRFCRIWFSWYLAVCLAFNGHNNEAGGAARIEDFKHILRMKVEKDKITVYVIGFEFAKADLKYLEPKLVDKFELKCKTFP